MEKIRTLPFLFLIIWGYMYNILMKYRKTLWLTEISIMKSKILRF